MILLLYGHQVKRVLQREKGLGNSATSYQFIVTNETCWTVQDCQIDQLFMSEGGHLGEVLFRLQIECYRVVVLLNFLLNIQITIFYLSVIVYPLGKNDCLTPFHQF